MTTIEFWNKLLELYWQMFQFDIMVFSTKTWMYKWICVPALAYLWFFCVKWFVLTFPLWIGPVLIARYTGQSFCAVLRAWRTKK